MYRRKFRHGIAIGLSELKADKAAQHGNAHASGICRLLR